MEIDLQSLINCFDRGVVVIDATGAAVLANVAGGNYLPPSGRDALQTMWGEHCGLFHHETGLPLERASHPASIALETGEPARGCIIKRQHGVETMVLEVKATSLDGTKVPMVLVEYDDVTNTLIKQRTLEHQALRDPLTGLGNRRHFANRYRAEAMVPERMGTIVFVDVDGLKKINDTFGHDEGDRLLVRLALLLRSCLRDSDLVARIGGDEFAVLVTGAVDTKRLIRRVLEAVGRENRRRDADGRLAVSLGWAQTEDMSDEPMDALLRRADEHMYHERKKRGWVSESRLTAKAREAGLAEPMAEVESA